MSLTCQRRTWKIHSINPVSNGEQRLRDIEAECLCSFEIDNQLKFCRKLNRQVLRFGDTKPPLVGKYANAQIAGK